MLSVNVVAAVNDKKCSSYKVRPLIIDNCTYQKRKFLAQKERAVKACFAKDYKTKLSNA